MNNLIHIVEDNEDIRFVMVYILNENGYVVTNSGSAREFSLYIQTASPDLILMDVMLPDGNGLELCKNLKVNPRTSSIPVIIMSAHATEQSILAETCADDFLNKPFDINNFLAMIKRQLLK